MTLQVAIITPLMSSNPPWFERIEGGDVSAWLSDARKRYPYDRYTIDMTTEDQIPVLFGGKGGDEEFRITNLSSRDIVECISVHGDDLRIVTGEFHCAVYDKSFRDAIVRAVKAVRRLVPSPAMPTRTQIVTGPVIMARNDEPSWKGTYLMELVQRGFVRVFRSLRRQPEHFRLAPRAVYFESPHSPGGENREAFRSWAPDPVGKYRRAWDRIMNSEDLVECEDVDAVKREFLLLTENQLLIVQRNAEEQKLDFNSFTKDDIINYISKDNLFTLPAAPGN